MSSILKRYNYILQTILICSGLLLVTSCRQDSNADNIDPISLLPEQSGWEIYAKNPIIKAGDFIDKGLWNDPCVIKENNQYTMFMTSSTKEPFKPPVLPFRAISIDGINWKLTPTTPLLDPAGSPFVSLETPSVILYKGNYHMYYSGIYPAGKVPSMAVGHAISSDGIKWENDPSPVVMATGTPIEWNGYLVAEPGAVVFNDRIYLYFTAMGARPGGNPPQLQTIALATSEDGSHFTKAEKVVSQSETYPAEKGFVGYSTPSALIHDSKVHLFYDVAYFGVNDDPQWQQVAIHHATSKDGRDFTQDKFLILKKSDFVWTNGGIAAPSVMVDGDQIKLWFFGHVKPKDLGPLIQRGIKGGEFGIGYATKPLSLFTLPEGAAPSVKNILIRN